MPSISIYNIIISKLSYWQQLYLIILLLIDKYLEIYLYDIVLSLNLAIYLWVKNYK